MEHSKTDLTIMNIMSYIIIIIRYVKYIIISASKKKKSNIGFNKFKTNIQEDLINSSLNSDN